MEDMVFGRRYRVTERLGGGGMAEVYKAVDETLGRTVAVKVLHERFSDDPDFIQRFRHEASAAANLSHPGIVNIYDYGVEGSTYYIVMELVRGTDLKAIARQDGPLDPMKVAEYGAQVCAALSVAHGYGIIHRDIKPQNIVRTPDGAIKVMDFGIARAVDSDSTQTGSVLGTAQYVSPEQAQGRRLGPESDLYSLGVVLYELATGRPPFEGDTPVSVALKHVNDTPVAPREKNPAIPPALEAVILKAMQKDPVRRYRSAEEMRDDLLRVAAGRAVAAQPRVDDTTVMPVVERAPQAPSVRRGTQKAPTSPWVWVGVVAALVLLGVLGAWAGGLFNGVVTVPDTTGMTLEAAKAAIIDAGLKPGNVDSRADAEVAVDMVVATDPASGSLARRGQTVDIILSSGPDLAVVPDVTGSAEAAAILELQEEDFAVDPNFTREYNADFPVGTVFRTDPEGGSEVARGTTVHLWISLGAEMAPVPMVVGMTQTEAKKTLEDAGFEVKVTKQPDNEVSKGTVIDQTPAADGQAPLGSEVTILVSSGPEQVTVPNVVGLTQAEAVAKIQAVGLTDNVQYLTDANPDREGKVLNQDPDGNQKAMVGATVTIWVGKLP